MILFLIHIGWGWKKMNLLLDTQIFIWADQDRAKLSPSVQAIYVILFMSAI